MKLLKIIINQAKRGLCFDSSVQNFVCVCVCLSHNYGHSPFPIVKKFNLLSKSECCLCNDFFISQFWALSEFYCSQNYKCTTVAIWRTQAECMHL